MGEHASAHACTEWARSMTDYVMSHPHSATWNAHRAIETALLVLVNDIGAAQEFTRLIGLDVDLYGPR